MSEFRATEDAEDFYDLAVGNTYYIREYSPEGSPRTGPTTQSADIVMKVVKADRGLSGDSSLVDVHFDLSDGTQQHLVLMKDPLDGRTGIAVAGLRLPGVGAELVPPVFVLKSPVREGTRWGRRGVSIRTSLLVSGSVTYTGGTTGPLEIMTPAGLFTGVYKNVISYKITVLGVSALSGQEVYWFAPKVGLVQHSYKRGSQVIHPYRQLVSYHHGNNTT